MLCEGESYLNLYHPGSDSVEIIFCKIFMPFIPLVLWMTIGKEWLVSKKYLYYKTFQASEE